MPRTKSGPRPVMFGDKLQLRRAVAYTIGHAPKHNKKAKFFMLSVYVKVYARVHSDAEITWLLGARSYVPRSTSEEEQMSLLDALTYKAALQLNRDFVIVQDANPKQPTLSKENDDGV